MTRPGGSSAPLPGRAGPLVPWWLPAAGGLFATAGVATLLAWTATAASAAFTAASGHTATPGDVLRALVRSSQHSPAGLPAGVAHGPLGLFWGLFAVQVAVVAAAAVWAAVWVRRWRSGNPAAARQMRRERAEREDSSAWAGPAETADLTDDGDPLRFPLGVTSAGHRLAAPARQSQAVLAPTDAGKTSRYVVPAVLRLCQARMPKVVASVKADVVALTWQAAASTGPVWLFAPGGLGDRPVCRWNPLEAAGTFGGASDVAGWLQRSERTEHVGAGDMKFWHVLAHSLLTPMLFAAAATDRTMADIYRWVQYKNEDTVQQILDDLRTDAMQASRGARSVAELDVADARLSDVDDALAMWAATRGRDTRQKQSVFSTAESIFEGFNHPDVRDLMSGTADDPDVLTPAKLLDSGGTVYLVATKTKVDQFGAVFEALMAQIVHEVEKRSAADNGRPIRPGLAIVLEEAANIARLPNLPYMASALRGLGVLLMTVWQDLGQIEELYGPAKARTILNNHSWKVYLPGTTDPATLRALSEQVGTYRREEHTTSTGADGQMSVSTRLVDADAAPLIDLQTMPAGHAVVITGKRRPIRVRSVGWYEDGDARALVDPAVAAAFDADFAGPSSSSTPASSRRRGGDRR